MARALGDEWLSKLGLAPGSEDVAKIGRALARHFGFPHFLLGLRIPVSVEEPRLLVWHNFPPAWINRYDEAGHFSVDPMLARSQRSSEPFFWDELTADRPGQSAYLAEAAAFGLVHGLTVPLAGPANSIGLFSLARGEAIPVDAWQRWEFASQVRLHASLLHEHVLALAVPVSASRDSASRVLTARERECLTLAARGMTGVQIAADLGVAPSTVAFHIDRSVKKLGVRSRRAAVGRALLLGEISLIRYPERIQGTEPQSPAS